MTRKKLLLDACEEDFTINQAYAKAYEQKKMKEELSKLEDKYGDDISTEADSESCSSDNEIEDENGDLVTAEVEANILTTIAKIRQKDPEIYDSSIKFFDERKMEELKKNQIKNQIDQPKPVFMKDMIKKDLSEENLLAIINSDESENDANAEENQLPYVEEQKTLKKSILKLVDEADSSDGSFDLFKKRVKSAEELEKEEESYREFLLQTVSKIDKNKNSMREWLEFTNNPDSIKDENEKFLVDYVLNRGWTEKKKTTPPSYDEIIQDVEDEESVEKMEEFEYKHNFRYEQEGGCNITTHARNVPESLRREDNTRKLKRSSYKERKEAEKKQKIEEIKRLKNLKKAEIMNRIKKIQEIGGLKQETIFDDSDVEGEFNAKEYDEKMQKIFNDSYYNSKEMEKPVFDDSDEELKAIENIIEKKIIRDDEARIATAKKQAPKSIKNIGLSTALSELDSLECEDFVGGIPTRFKYRNVDPVDFGLTTENILDADDRDLNEYVSLKKLAPYRPKEKQESDIQKLSKKKRLKKFLAKQKKIN